MIVQTAQLRYTGPDRLDITRKTGGPDGLPFAPSWDLLAPRVQGRRAGVVYTADDDEAYRQRYLEEMRTSYRTNREAWHALLARERVVLVCYCAEGKFCHRRVLVEDVLRKLGAFDAGEIHLRTSHEMADHRCHVSWCKTRCKPEYLMCGVHWAMVPKLLQFEVYRHYRVGQCEDMRPTRAYLEAARAAIASVPKQEELFR